MYCNELIVPSGCTLNLNGLHLYYHQAQINGTLLGADPTVTMTSPTNGLDTNDNLPTLAATAVDNSGSGLASVKFLLSANGGTFQPVGGLETTGPYSYTFSTPLADGNYQAEATATDNEGDVGTSAAVRRSRSTRFHPQRHMSA